MGRPPGAHTAPAAPSIRARWATLARPAKLPATAGAPRTASGAPARTGRAVCAQHHLRVQQRQQGVEVPPARRGQEGLHQRPLPAHVRRGVRRGAPHPAPGPAGQLPGRRRGASHQGAISAKGMANRSCSTKATRSAGGQSVQHHQQGQPHRVGQQRLVLRVASTPPRRPRYRLPHLPPDGLEGPQGLLPPRRPRPQRRPGTPWPPRSSASPPGSPPSPRRPAPGAARPPARRPPPRWATPGGGRPPPAGEGGATRSAPPATRAQPSASHIAPTLQSHSAAAIRQ